MTARAYYNEIDPFAAEWLRQLILADLIAPGDVDTRSIEDVRPSDLAGYTQCHFFAGIGVWSHALREAGWPDDRPVWTGSCPCQPFSTAGKRGGLADERHLWPAFHHLIRECRPGVVIGEQVASRDGLAWLDIVHTDMEAEDYAFAAVDLCAAGVGAPHIRQRLWWVGLADCDEPRLERRSALPERADQRALGAYGVAGGLADCDGGRLGRLASGEGREFYGATAGRLEDDGRAEHGGALCGLGLPYGQRERAIGDVPNGTGDKCQGSVLRKADQPGPTNGFWRDADWLGCRDARWRPVEPFTFPLAHGASARVGSLRGYGNAIVAPLATTFIEAIMGILG